MNSGLGPTLTIIVGGLLWLLYLAPNLRDRAETRHIERNARRIAATTEELGIRPKTPLREMSAREMAAHRRELERLSRTTERHAERAERERAFTAAPHLASRHRFMKLVLTATIFGALVGVGFAVSVAAWSIVAIAAGVGLLGVLGLVAVNTTPVTAAAVVARPARQNAPVLADPTWTPVRVPPVHRSIPDGAGLIVTDENAKAIAARERAARIRAQAARAAQSGAAVDPRFVEHTTPVTDETSTIDITAALRARRAN